MFRGIQPQTRDWGTRQHCSESLPPASYSLPTLFAALSQATSPIICTTWRQYLSRSQQLPHASRRHAGVPSATSVFRARCPLCCAFSLFPGLEHANSFASYHIPATPAVSCNYALFALFSALRSFVFNSLQPLLEKHPGWYMSLCGSFVALASFW